MRLRAHVGEDSAPCDSVGEVELDPIETAFRLLVGKPWELDHMRIVHLDPNVDPSAESCIGACRGLPQD